MKTKQKSSKMLIHPASIGMLVENTWNFAHNILWQNESLSQEETTLIKSYIREYYEEIPAKKFRKKALKYHQRICGYVLAAKGMEQKTFHILVFGLMPCIPMDWRECGIVMILNQIKLLILKLKNHGKFKEYYRNRTLNTKREFSLI